MTYLVTGCAGFIGFHTAVRLLKQNKKVVGIDSINNYYSVLIKADRLKILRSFKNFYFFKIDLSNEQKKLIKIFKKYQIKKVIHLAAQAGVRYSIENPGEYIKSNLIGFFNIIDVAAKSKIKHFVYASTSSVYGNIKNFPLKEEMGCNKPIQLYAATKKSNELIAHSYSYIHKLQTTGLRFFTVYGPWGRPDMALYKFTKNIIEGKKIELFNKGKHVRDFSYIDDVVYYIISIVNKPHSKSQQIPFRVLNVGNNKPEKLMKYVKLIEKYLNKKAKIKNLKLQKGDVFKTHASMKNTWKLVKRKKTTNIKVGIQKFVEWYKKYHDHKRI